MKVLIWVVCCLVASIIKVLLIGNGSMGAVPALIFYGCAFGIARALCNAWDKQKNDKASEK